MPKNGTSADTAFGRFIPKFTDTAEKKQFRSDRAPTELRDLRATQGLFITGNSFFAPLGALLFDQDLTFLLIL